MYLCVRGVMFASMSTILIFDFDIILTVLHVLVFILFTPLMQINTDKLFCLTT